MGDGAGRGRQRAPLTRAFPRGWEGVGEVKGTTWKAAWSWPIRDYRESGEPGHKHARHLAASR